MNPVVIVGAFWSVKLEHMLLFTVPVLGIVTLVLGGFLALGISKFQRLSRAQTGSMFVSGSFTNMGSFGTLFCFVFFGADSLVFVAMFRLLEEFVYYSVGFPIAKIYGTRAAEEGKPRRMLANIIKDPFILASLLSIVVGSGLHLTPLERPHFWSTLIDVLVPLSTLLLVISIGFNMKFMAVQGYLKQCFAISAVKFVMVPACMVTMAYGVGLGDVYNGIVPKVILVLSAMPPAFTSLIPPQLYKLDVDLANSSWLLNTALLILVLPVLYVAVSAL
ncbi:MAG: Auxin Efflux Carrier [Paenibacillus sp.]|jgi:predicted permease|nr:Auxin Efflux Carrier [Paenibacillus sp.]